MREIGAFFRENPEAFYALLGVIALFAEGGRRRYRRYRACKIEKKE